MIFKDKHGNDLFLLGVNYWPSSSALNMWTEWNQEEIQDDIKRMVELGINCCRPFLFMPAFMDNPQVVNPLMIERLHFFLQQCDNAGLYTLPTFVVGHMSGEDWNTSWCSGKTFVTDPDAIDITKKYIKTIVKETKKYSYIIGWLLSNELPNFIGDQSAADVESWVKEICAVIRTEDPNRPISTGDGTWTSEIVAEESGFVLRKLNKYQDFVGLHYYPRGMSPWHHAYTTAFRLRLAQEWGRPAIVEEFGTSTTLCSEKNQANYYREVFYSALINGAQGALGWCLNDFDFENKRPYTHHTFEERFGVIKVDKSLKPAALEFQPFNKVVSELIEHNSSKIENVAGLFIPSNYYYKYPYEFQPDFRDWYNLYLETFSLLKRGNIDVKMLFEPAQELENDGLNSHELVLNPEEIPVLFFPRLKLMTKPMRTQLDQYLQDGGTIYFSFANDSWVLDWHHLAGIEMDCKFGVPDFYKSNTLNLIVKDDWGEFHQNEKLVIPNLQNDPEFSYCRILDVDSDVIIECEDGSPFLIKKSVGKGTVYFCAFPIEMLALYNHDESWKYTISKIYRSIYHSIYKNIPISVQGDGIESGIWEDNEKFSIILLNHSWNDQLAQVSVNLPDWSVEHSGNIPYKIIDNKILLTLSRKGICHMQVLKH